jgi:N-acetylmuramic acid 6-phosphate etherase
MRRDYASLLTEQRNPRTRGLDAMSTSDLLSAINREDATIAAKVRASLPQVEKAVELVVRRLARGGRLLFAGAGTSGRLGVLEAAELPPTFGVPRELAQAAMAGGPECVFASKEGAEDRAADGAREVARRRIAAKDVVVGVAASGGTPFVAGALAEARRRRAGRVLVACAQVPRSAADVVISVAVGPEVIAGSTRLRAGTATKMVLNMITTAAMVRLGKAAGGRVKTAIVMLRRGVGRAEAERRLARAGGILRRALES